ncbi:cupin domain-containing protein [Phytoactinopolyspora limicola]|uniref:cupin domain-containing protein n=1 Tax=Phytoactinopolyspora limicola TaxID=2715536 RepID=UPI00140DDEEF|nr:cupin domain-containing protein [Phytoactinopolyspora limicola]
MTLPLELVNIDNPTETTEFPLGRFEVFRVGGQEIGQATYEPGWHWREHVGPIVGTELCQTPHIGFVLCGKAAVSMADGTEIVLSEGNFFSIPPGHDSWVLGEEMYVSLHLAGADTYARTR